MIQYSYKIRQLVTQDRDSLTRVVVKILYTAVGKDTVSGVEATVPDQVDLEFSSGAEFTDFGSLTETQVLGWLNSQLDSVSVTTHQTRLQAEIAERNQQVALNTQLVTQLPWMTSEVDPVPDQAIIFTNLDSLRPVKELPEPPGCYLLNPDGTLKDPSEIQ